MPYRALVQLRENIKALLAARKETQTTLALYMQRDPSTVNKFLNGTREIQFADIDAIADFFGLATYQLFQPGISLLTERRRGGDRRGGLERRISRVQREALRVQEASYSR